MFAHKKPGNLIEDPGRENRHARYAAVDPYESSKCARLKTGTAQKCDRARFSGTVIGARATQETADTYARVVARLCDGWRVIVCKDGIQWILQRRKNGGADRPWRAVGYFRTREALIRLCAASCWRIDPAALAALAALPERIGGAA